jgi:hypothetical protein
LRQLNS